jgi:hypothetical protein
MTGKHSKMKRDCSNICGDYSLTYIMARITFSLGVRLLNIMESSTLHLGNLEEVLRSLAIINGNYYYFLCGKIDTENSDSFVFKKKPVPAFIFYLKETTCPERRRLMVIVPKYRCVYVTKAAHDGVGSLSLSYNCYELQS